MNNKEVSLRDQLDLLRGMTIRTGSIHEAQALQLKMWPLLIPGVKSSEATVDTERKIVTFSCTGPKRRLATKKLDLTIKNINDWTKQLLWPDTTVIVKINSKVIFDSRSRQ